MNEQNFSLQPFNLTSSISDLKITGSIAGNGNNLTICYALLGDLTKVEIPTPADLAKRKYDLWEETCFELFVGIKNSPYYWEFNLSPAGHWNVFRLEDYRQGLQEEMSVTSLPFSVEHKSDALLVDLEVDLNQFILAWQSLEVAITTVIKSKDGNLSYWALTHCGEEADFHRRESFVVEL
ncbi:DOMON-like domain-containing protein [Scytonema hofmannii FACHB-248]|uniref:DOMON-like domain-containing protein n=1 Tax=Scytonema hofmannii FACHB-248 TaxID=1842502 RepID=A0ABR8GL58_9CYAN|nr:MULTISPECIES: DOMON-like domain-containing protein [Nostocales]MBD2603951.1 DOMON-like domain-containing protein [Scytonema hofmannii FACHB-248]